MHSTPLPVHLITGLLGSGKTTTVKHLLTQKPENERWGILINEFGDIDIDVASLQSNASEQVSLKQVSGGCVCCTAQLSLVEAINQLLTQNSNSNQPLDRLLIEPTGLGHPAKIIDTLKHTTFKQPLALQAIVCVITPKQLTETRWQKSAVMRDLVTLADIVVLNQTDLSSESQQACSNAILENLYPSKSQVIHSRFGAVPLNTLMQAHTPAPFVFLAGLDEHHNQMVSESNEHASTIANTQACQVSTNAQQNIISVGWVWPASLQFNRVKLKTFFATLAPKLNRAKGLLKTGNEWQLINWTEQQLQFSDIAWRQDSRLELLIKPKIQLNFNDLKYIEAQLLNCIHKT